MKARLVATSWDDGLESDKRLLDILAKYGVRASFAITPSRHLHCPTPNDIRDIEKYGMLMTRDELKLYTDHDVCNHTANHYEMTMHGPWQREITQGKYELEDMFGREILGMIWPYGVSNPICCMYAKNVGHEFGRTTPAAHRAWVVEDYCRWDIMPFHWRTPLSEILDSPHSALALSGHTYELQSEDDWLYLDEFYRTLSSDPRRQLVTLDELSKDIAKYESGSCL